jgi:hypothetical protein
MWKNLKNVLTYTWIKQKIIIKSKKIRKRRTLYEEPFFSIFGDEITRFVQKELPENRF